MSEVGLSSLAAHEVDVDVVVHVVKTHPGQEGVKLEGEHRIRADILTFAESSLSKAQYVGL